MSLPSGSNPLPIVPSRQPDSLQARPSRHESPSSGPFLTGHPPPLLLPVRILPLRRSQGTGPSPSQSLGKSDTLSPAGPPPGHPSRRLQYPAIPSPQVSQALVRSFSSTARNRFENRVAEKQKLFQVGGAGGGPGAACLVLKRSWAGRSLRSTE